MQTKRFQMFPWLVLINVCAGCAEPTTATRQSEPPTARILEQDTVATDVELKKLAANLPSSCNAAPDPKQAQYIIGYGSLMQDQSRQRSVPNAATAYPVMVKGYRRGWLAKGPGVGFDTTYLGTVPDQDGRFNAVLYHVSPDDIPAMDKREFFYCRLAVEPTGYTLLKPGTPTPQGQVWIYANKPDSVATANELHPIVQSYVDIFVSGCLEQEQRYALENFAEQCLATTSHWSTAWVNDRLYPRRPYIYQPKAGQIDKLLQEQLPDYFRKIHLESAN
ncbi:MAG: gamma-glutamylcyclotransferase [Methylococcaceae bacterium]|nr:gamma-glutamylcyclotransferase [Methylococcaceae bacterium]